MQEGRQNNSPPKLVRGWLHPDRVKRRLEIAESQVREARRLFPGIAVRFQPMLRVSRGKTPYRLLRGESFLIDVPEPIDVWDIWRDVRRFLSAWRPWRRRTAEGDAAARQALELWERASRQMKP